MEISTFDDLLHAARPHTHPASVKARLRCLTRCLEAAKMFSPAAVTPFALAIAPEVVLRTREQSGEARTLAMALLDAMYRHVASGAPPVGQCHFAL